MKAGLIGKGRSGHGSHTTSRPGSAGTSPVMSNEQVSYCTAGCQRREEHGRRTRLEQTRMPGQSGAVFA